jgi:AmiR/NasT family two-component response regulator
MIDADRTAVRHIAERSRTTVSPDRQFGALASRDVVNQAKGILLERYGVTADAAFGLLQRLSEKSGVALVDVAHQLVNREGLILPAAAADPNVKLRREMVREATRC